MPGRSATSRKWRNGLLQAARAGAFLSIATGVNSILTGLYPRYEPFYAYLISVFVVAWLSSALLGVTTAIVAVILYDWMFSPVRIVPSMSAVVPLTVAVALAIATRAVKIPVRPRAMLAKAPDPPLLPSVTPLPAVNILRDDPRVEDLTRQLAAAHARADDEAALRAEANVAAEASVAKLTNDIETLRHTIGEQNGRWAVARREIEVAAKRLQDAETRAASAQQELEAARRRLEEESTRAARETAMREQLEVAGQASLQKAIADLSAKHEAALTEAKQLSDTSQKSVAELTARKDAIAAEAQKRVEAATARMNALQRELDRTLASLSEEHARADRETKLRTQLETAARGTLQRTAEVSTNYQREAKEARDGAKAAEERATAAERELARLRSQLSAAQLQNEEDALELQRTKQALEDETLRATFEAAARQKTADEAATIRQELERLAGEIEQERNRTIEAHAQREMAARDSEEKAGQAQVEIEAAKAGLLSASQKIQELLAQAAQIQAEREQMAREFDDKLQKVVTGITNDYEAAAGETLIEKEAAKAELRRANKRIEELQAQAAKREADAEQMARGFGENLQKAHQMVQESEARAAQAQADLQQERRRADDEKAAREKLDAEWNDKLQKIVGHLTEDHETDLGEAMLQREGARAEARSLTARVTALQQKLEEERDRFRQAAERWQQQRTSSRPSFPPTIEQPLPAPSGSPRQVVLIVHSDAGIRAMTKHSLEQAGYSVLTAADGLEGLRTATQQKPDVVIAEGVMPKMNARELVQLLKSRSETAGVKIVLISSSGTAERGADFRADEVIADPVDFNRLRATLESVLAS
ncbi:MAG TPA: response regulator [Thermoanaerobaculia bacterium]|nr:response regulator [Thermoanaerobaculia bacterium]